MKADTSALFGSDYHRTILDAMPCPVFVVEEDVRILDFNTAASAILNEDRKIVLRQRAGDVLHCIHSLETPEGCGHAVACTECPIRNSVNRALLGETPPRQTVKMELLLKQGEAVEALFLITVAPLTFENIPMAVVILEDIREISLLRQMLPICANCKQVRDDTNYWQSVESYLSSHLEIDCSHSLCPDCAKKLFPEYASGISDENNRLGR